MATVIGNRFQEEVEELDQDDKKWDTMIRIAQLRIAWGWENEVLAQMIRNREWEKRNTKDGKKELKRNTQKRKGKSMPKETETSGRGQQHRIKNSRRIGPLANEEEWGIIEWDDGTIENHY